MSIDIVAEDARKSKLHAHYRVELTHRMTGWIFNPSTSTYTALLYAIEEYRGAVDSQLVKIPNLQGYM
jgi:hypothetical protein